MLLEPLVRGPNDRYVILIFVLRLHPRNTLDIFIVSVLFRVILYAVIGCGLYTRYWVCILAL